MKFGKALDTLTSGLCSGIRLPQWSEDVVIRMQVPDPKSKMTHPYLYAESRFGNVPWKETMVEMFTEQWVTVGDIQ